jgi:ketosteroid isomerase-like protein
MAHAWRMNRIGSRFRALFGCIGVAAAVLSLMAAERDRGVQETAATAESLRCAVWQREASFADSVARHDEAAFAEHLAEGAVFVNAKPPHLQGRAEIIDGWRSIIAGEQLILRWHPEFVAVGGDGRTALSRGPFTMERPDSNPEARFRIGTFQSVWTLAADGHWRVLFDGGGPPPEPATETEVRAAQASWTRVCPYPAEP